MKKKLMALFLALTMAVSLVTPAFAAGGMVTSPSEVLASTPVGRAALLSAWDFEVFQKDDLDKAVEEATVNLFEKTQIMLGELDIPGVDFQWQIAVPDQDFWVDIQGEDKLGLDLSYAKVASLLNEDGEAQVRCEVSLGSLVFQGPIITVDVDEDAKPESEPVEEKEPVVLKGPEVVIHDSQPAEPEEPEAEEPAPEAPVVPPVQQEPEVVPEVVPEEPVVVPEEPATELDRSALEESVVAVYNHRNKPLSASTKMVVATETKALTKYDLTINYTLDGKQVADPYYASLAEGSSFDVTVKNPVVMGYQASVGTLPPGVTYDKTTDSINIDIDNMQGNVIVNVVYQPAPVDYTVIHYKQNVKDDNYTEALRETLTEPTGTEVPEVAEDYEGFYALAYEHPNVAADGSTVVEIYYDRGYYLMNFDLGGGYGVEPIYARYGAPISVGTPTKEGYTFVGWSLNGTDIVTLPETMPEIPEDETRTYIAIWSNPNAVDYTVVYWKENPNDTNYSYWGSETKSATADTTVSGGDTLPASIHSGEKQYFTYNDALTDSNVTVKGDGSTIVNVYYARKTYTLTFTTNELTCGKEAHAHSVDCYNYENTEHTHSESCCSKSGPHFLHTCNSNDCPYLTCTLPEHQHTDGSWGSEDCFGSDKTVKTITAKYQQDIRSYFPIVGTNNAKYSGYWWEVPDGATFFDSGTYVVSIDTMPGENLTFKGEYMGIDAKIYYYLEALAGAAGSTEYSGKKFDLFKTVITVDSGNLTYLEEFHDITGFSQWKSNPEFSSHDENGRAETQPENFLYYTRNSYLLKYYNYNSYLTDEQKTVQYQAALTNCNIENPPYPSKLEANAYRFEGWYTTEDCLEGTKVNFTTMTMPATDLVLYANWVPVTHTVEFYLTKDAYEANTPIGDTHPTVTVPHGTIMETLPATPTNNNGYEFVGWFYMENGVEKAIDFANMPVNKNLKVYGKWNSSILAKYTVYYKVKGTDTQIAEPTTGSGLVGNTKTFDAKGDEELKEGYREGYYPVVNSHSMTLEGTEAKNVFTFEYVKAPPVPYTVYYVTDSQDEAGTRTEVTLNGETYYIVSPTKIVTDNPKAVVTENFVPVPNMIPDAYQKRLVLSVNADGTPKTEENVIIFHYTEDSTHAYYKITHYTQNVSGTGWDEYTYSQAIGTIKQTYTANPLDISGFTFDPTIEGTVQSGVLTANGLELKLYYTRNQYPYQVRYLEQITGKQLADPKPGKGYYDQLITENAITIDHYTAVDPKTQSMNLYVETGDEAKLNVITFFYTENVAKINYAVGSSGGGTVAPASESVKVLTGVPRGSIATANSGYTFAGWYTDAACKNPVEASWLDGTRIVPTKEESAAWVDGTTYYAKFVENEVTIKYQAVGPENATNFGSVSPQNETLAIYTGNAQGSVATASDGYQFVGWYNNAECTGDAISTDENFVPEKVDNKNVAATYYAKFEEKQVTINYVVVGPTDCGTVDPVNEQVNAVTGTANGSTAEATSNVYKFVGWYKDAACEKPVTSADGTLSDENAKFVPAKVNGKNVAATYYAKFAYNLTSLTIKKTGCSAADANQSFVFTVTGEGLPAEGMEVVITGNGSVTIDGLTVGKQYTVTEDTNWSWRYTPDVASKSKQLSATASQNTVEFVNTKTNSNWLSAVASAINTWTSTTITQQINPSKVTTN